MFLSKLFKKKNDVSEIQYKFAANPVMVDPSKMDWVVKPIMVGYIKAIYAQNTEFLPSRKMREELYLSTIESIKKDSERFMRTCNLVKIINMRAGTYDMAKIATYRGVDIDAVFNVRGTCNRKMIDEKRKARFSFINDQRQGWVLDNWKDMGKVEI